MTARIKINFNLLDTIKPALETDTRIFYAHQLFDLSLQVEEYTILCKKHIPQTLIDDGSPCDAHIVVDARIESEIYSCVLEKSHPIYINTTYLVSS